MATETQEEMEAVEQALRDAAIAWRKANALILKSEASKDALMNKDYPAYNFFMTSGFESLKAADRLANVLHGVRTAPILAKHRAEKVPA